MTLGHFTATSLPWSSFFLPLFCDHWGCCVYGAEKHAVFPVIMAMFSFGSFRVVRLWDWWFPFLAFITVPQAVVCTVPCQQLLEKCHITERRIYVHTNTVWSFCMNLLVTYLTTFGPWPCSVFPPPFPVHIFVLHRYPFDNSAAKEFYAVSNWLALEELPNGNPSLPWHDALIHRKILRWIVL